MASVKTIAETPNLVSIPSSYIFSAGNSHSGVPADAAPQGVEDSIPTIDFSLLINGTPHQRAKVIDELGKACQAWGFFMVINHGVEERVMKEIVEIFREFFDLKEEKREYETKHVLDPIRYGTSFNPKTEKVFFWRDYLKIMVHPKFHSPSKPPRFRDLGRIPRKSWRNGKGIVERDLRELGVGTFNLEKAVNLKSSSQILVGNLYPPCPQPELAMGLPPHSDHCLLAVLLQNNISGLQILHDGYWVNVNPIPNSFLVNTGDQLEILSNGKYKSVIHRARVNNEATRMSVGIAIGPSLETVVGPAPELVHKYTNNPPLFKHIKYKDYMELMQNNNLQEKSILDRIRLL